MTSQRYESSRRCPERSLHTLCALMLCLLCCYFLGACGSREPSPQNGGEGEVAPSAEKISPIPGLIPAPDTEVGRKLKALQTEALPDALTGNAVAINICRQTMYGLGEVTALEEVTFDLVKPLPDKELDRWIKRLHDEADKKDPIAMTIIGALYYTGHGAPHDPQRALEQWKNAGLFLDYHDALSKLGNLYRVGEIVEKDIDKAIDYYTRAGALGSSIALWNLGAMYFSGEGVPRDKERAVLYYQMAARMGNTKAQVDLGLCYENGEGIPEDIDEAVRWYRESAGCGEFLGNVCLVRLGHLAVKFPPSENDRPNELEDKAVPTNVTYSIPSATLKGIYRSIRICDLETIDDELKKDPDILDQKDESGWTPLTLAIITGCKETVKYLLDKGIDVNRRHRELDFTPLHAAVLTKQKDLVELLIEKGADLNAVSNPPPMYWFSGMKGTPLHTASFTRKRGSSLHMLPGNGRYEILVLLLKKGADPDVLNPEGQTLFEQEVQFNNREVITQIFNMVGLPIPDVEPTMETLFNAMWHCDPKKPETKDCVDMQTLLKDHPEFIHQTTKGGWTPLHIACRKSNREALVRQIIGMGADVNARGDNGNTPLHEATNSRENASLLVENGAHVNALNDDGRTPLHRLAEGPDLEGNLATAAFLLENGALKQVRDAFGKTPLDYARENDKAKTLIQDYYNELGLCPTSPL